jgi:hypothetical protein
MGINADINWVNKTAIFYNYNMHTEIKCMITTPYTAIRSMELMYQSP